MPPCTPIISKTVQHDPDTSLITSTPCPTPSNYNKENINTEEDDDKENNAGEMSSLFSPDYNINKLEPINIDDVSSFIEQENEGSQQPESENVETVSYDNFSNYYESADSQVSRKNENFV